MGDVSKHFSRHEFACNCGCGFAAVDAQLLEVLEDIRTYYNSTLTINSPCRCLAYNRKVGSMDTSYHVKAMACDIRVKGVEPEVVASYVEAMWSKVIGGVGRYSSFTHIDVGKKGRRWRG